MSSSLRPARRADLDAVLAVAAACPFSARWSRRQCEEEIDFPDSVFAVWEDGPVRGYLLARRVLAEVQVLDLAVRPGDQGRGLGRALLEHAAAAARAWGCAKLTLEVSAANAPAQRLYLRAGFQVVGRRRKFYNDGSDAILMDRPLA